MKARKDGRCWGCPRQQGKHTGYCDECWDARLLREKAERRARWEEAGDGGHYKSHGRTMSDRIMDLCVPEPNSGCWIWTGAQRSNGYGTVCYRRKHYKAHRLSWEAFRGPIPDGLWVLHKCDTPICVNPDHLFLGTAKNNTDDMWRKGRGARQTGESHPRCRLREAQVIEIRRLAAEGMSRRRLAEMFGVGQGTVQHVVTRQTWRHVL